MSSFLFSWSPPLPKCSNAFGESSLTCVMLTHLHFTDPNSGNCGLSSTRSMRGSGSIASERAAYFVQYIGVVGALSLARYYMAGARLHGTRQGLSIVHPSVLLHRRSESARAIPRRSSPCHLHRRLGRRYPRSINWWWWFNQRLPLPCRRFLIVVVGAVFVPPAACAAPAIARALREGVACTIGYMYKL
jgi:hypothetical protein